MTIEVTKNEIDVAGKQGVRSSGPARLLMVDNTVSRCASADGAAIQVAGGEAYLVGNKIRDSKLGLGVHGATTRVHIVSNEIENCEIGLAVQKGATGQARRNKVRFCRYWGVVISTLADVDLIENMIAENAYGLLFEGTRPTAAVRNNSVANNYKSDVASM